MKLSAEEAALSALDAHRLQLAMAKMARRAMAAMKMRRDCFMMFYAGDFAAKLQYCYKPSKQLTFIN